MFLHVKSPATRLDHQLQDTLYIDLRKYLDLSWSLNICHGILQTDIRIMLCLTEVES